MYDPRRQMGVSVYREQEKAFSVGDRIQLTALNHLLKIANRTGYSGKHRAGRSDAAEARWRTQYGLRTSTVIHILATDRPSPAIPAKARQPTASLSMWIPSLRRKTCSIAVWRMSLFRVGGGMRRYSRTTAKNCRKLLVATSRTRARTNRNKRLLLCSRRLHSKQKGILVWGWA